MQRRWRYFLHRDVLWPKIQQIKVASGEIPSQDRKKILHCEDTVLGNPFEQGRWSRWSPRACFPPQPFFDSVTTKCWKWWSLQTLKIQRDRVLDSRLLPSQKSWPKSGQKRNKNISHVQTIPLHWKTSVISVHFKTILSISQSAKNSVHLFRLSDLQRLHPFQKRNHFFGKKCLYWLLEKAITILGVLLSEVWACSLLSGSFKRMMLGQDYVPIDLFRMQYNYLWAKTITKRMG